MTLAARLRHAHALPPRLPPIAEDNLRWEGAFTPAAILVAITDRTEPGVILTVRQAGLRAHGGQIAFPGGRIDDGDKDVAAAALREADEEIALPPAQVDVIGQGDSYLTGSGYRIEPVVGVIPPDLALHPNEAEVAEIFEAPLAYLIDPANHRPLTITMRGQPRRIHEIVWGGFRIWGITAALIVNLSRRLERLA